jgi:hypothetical protein
MGHKKVAISLSAALLTGLLTGCESPLIPVVTVVGLWPEQPPPLGFQPSSGSSSGGTRWSKLENANPELRWESFPRPKDVDAAITNNSFGQFNSVSYDLRIWRARGSGARQAPGVLVYARDALPAPEHKVETSLDRRSWYFWTVRARFQLNGQTRVTEWSRVDTPDSARVPDSRYFRFYLD